MPPDKETEKLSVVKKVTTTNAQGNEAVHTEDRPTGKMEIDPCYIQSLPLDNEQDHVSLGKWTLVKYSLAKLKKCYVGQITKFNDSNEDVGKFEAHFLRRSGRTGQTFLNSLLASQINIAQVIHKTSHNTEFFLWTRIGGYCLRFFTWDD